MKNTGSSYFEEAYLILKNDLTEHDRRNDTHDLAREADRIIREASSYFRGKGKRRFLVNRAAMFALGAAFASLVIGVIALLIGII